MRENNKLTQYIEECQFHHETLKLVFDEQFSLKNMKQSERVNFRAVEQSIRSFLKVRMEQIIIFFKRAKLSEEDRFDLGNAIANVYELLEGQLVQLLGTASHTTKQED